MPSENSATAEKSQVEVGTRTNSLMDLVESNGPSQYRSQTIAQPFTFSEGMSYTPFTLNRIALSYGYMSYGLVQTVVDQPVEDAFRGGIIIHSKELDEEDLATLHQAMVDNDDIKQIKNTVKWGRLYGGSGLIIVTDQNPQRPLNIASLSQDEQLRFLAADRWELILNNSASLSGNQYQIQGYEQDIDKPYNYYGLQLDPSRAVRFLGKEAPSFIRQRLQGWGMSELERCMREINTYIKFQNLLFELVDEAKIDVYRIERFNEQLATAQGTALVNMRVQLGNLLKNYRNALVMDKEDEYQQKQIAFSGLADIMQEFRINLSSALKIPMNKLFGQSATGISSGEDSMENYNSMVDTDVRDASRPLVNEALKMRMQVTFGYVPKFTFQFRPLRVMSETEEEIVKTSRQKRALELYDRDLMAGQETMSSLQRSELLNVDSEVLKGKREPISPLEMQQDAQDQKAKTDASAAKNKPAAAQAGKTKKNGIDRLRESIGRQKFA